MQKKILIIEDEHMLAEIIERHLKTASYEVRVAVDGEKGFTEIQEYKPDLVLLDITLPSIDGNEILDRMQSDPTLSSIPVVVMSNSDEPTNISNAVIHSAHDYIIKANLTPQDIVERVTQVLVDNDQTIAHNRKDITVLVIEDDQNISELASIVLEEDFTVATAKNAVEALKKAEELHPDVFLIDIMLPDTNGFEVLRHIRENTSFNESVCIMFTNLSQTTDRQKAEALGADAYYVKANLNIKLLPEVVRENIAKKKEQVS